MRGVGDDALRDAEMELGLGTEPEVNRRKYVSPVSTTTGTGYSPVHACGEVTSPNLRPRYDRHFVGITWHNVWS